MNKDKLRRIIFAANNSEGFEDGGMAILHKIDGSIYLEPDDQEPAPVMTMTREQINALDNWIGAIADIVASMRTNNPMNTEAGQDARRYFASTMGLILDDSND